MTQAEPCAGVPSGSPISQVMPQFIHLSVELTSFVLADSCSASYLQCRSSSVPVDPSLCGWPPQILSHCVQDHFTKTFFPPYSHKYPASSTEFLYKEGNGNTVLSSCCFSDTHRTGVDPDPLDARPTISI